MYNNCLSRNDLVSVPEYTRSNCVTELSAANLGQNLHAGKPNWSKLTTPPIFMTQYSVHWTAAPMSWSKTASTDNYANTQARVHSDDAQTKVREEKLSFCRRFWFTRPVIARVGPRSYLGLGQLTTAERACCLCGRHTTLRRSELVHFAVVL